MGFHTKNNISPNSLFFIALLPDKSIQAEITLFKQECAALFGSKHALKTPPHITLIAPFRWNISRLEELKNNLKSFTKKQTEIDIYLKGFNCFPPKVIFVNVAKNNRLTQIQSDLYSFLKITFNISNKYGNRFTPHITIAHRDLQKELFSAAWSYFSQKEYSRNFSADKISLLQHINGKWQIIEEFEIESNK